MTAAGLVALTAAAGLSSRVLAAPPVAPTAKAGPDNQPAPLVFETEERVVEVGFYPRELMLEFLFEVRAPGAVRVLNLSSSCPCTTVAMERTSYYPGEKGLIAAIFDYKGETTPATQTVQVVTDRSAQPQQLRVVPRRTTRPIWAERSELRWITAQRRAPQTVEVEVAPEHAAQPLRATPTATGWRVAVEPLAPAGRYRLTVEPLRDDAPAAAVQLALGEDTAATDAPAIALVPAG